MKEYSTKPKIDKKSENISMMISSRLIKPIYDSLIDHGSDIKRKNEVKKREKDIKEIKTCSFQPKINVKSKEIAERTRGRVGSRVSQKYLKPEESVQVNHFSKNKHSQSKVIVPDSSTSSSTPNNFKVHRGEKRTRKNSDITSRQARTSLKEIKENRVKPKKRISRADRTSNEKERTVIESPPIPSVVDDETQKAFEEEIQKEYPEDQLVTPPPPKNDNSFDNNSQANSTTSKSNSSIPLLFIDIHLDDKDVHRLTVNDGDKPETLAEIFCAQYSKMKPSLTGLDIDGEMKVKLTELIRGEVDKLLTRIDENDEEEGNNMSD